MRSVRPISKVLGVLVTAGLACGGAATTPPTPTAHDVPASASPSTSSPTVDELGVRSCLYDPAAPQAGSPFASAPGTPTPYPTPTLPAAGAVDPQEKAAQIDVFNSLWNAVNDHYVDPGFNGHDWAAIGGRYKALVDQGISNEDFYPLLQRMINELGDEHSYIQSPTEVAKEESAALGQVDFVGIGALLQNTTDGAAQIILVFPNGPAAEAGLLPHDTILAVDGGPVRGENGVSRTLGPVGTTVGLMVRTPGEAPREITLTRRRVAGGLPVDSCKVPGSRLGYVLLPTFLDETIDDQLRDALTAMTGDGPLDGLILDMRMNGGGLGSVAQASLGMFLGGSQGAFVTRTTREDFVVEPEDIGGSQTMSIVVLVSPETVSYGEVVSGILQHAGRATVVGQPTLGNVEQLRRYDFPNGSRAWIASATFEPIGLPAGIWEDTGIVPEVFVAGKWDEFREADDPGLAAAVGILLAR